MKIKKVGLLYFVLIVFLLAGILGSNFKTAKAAGEPKIYVTSSKTSFLTTEQITATVKVEGGTEAFTSFKANVGLTNLRIVSGPTLGSSVSNWQTQPSASSLNFFGGVQGTTTSVTVFSVKLQAISAGAASVNVSSGAIYQVQGDGMTILDILATQTGASYTVTKPSSTSAPSPTVDSTTATTETTTSVPESTDNPTTSSSTSSTETPTSNSSSTVTSTDPATPSTVATSKSATSKKSLTSAEVANSIKGHGPIWFSIWIAFFIGLSTTIVILVIKKLKTE